MKSSRLTRIMQATGVLVDKLRGPIQLKKYSVSSAPDANVGEGCVIYVEDDIGGPVPAFSDGTNWLRFTDRAIISNE